MPAAIVRAVPDSASAERVALTLPGERRSIGIARLFVGGLAARLGLGYETMDDLQLALESILLKAELSPEITLEAAIDGETVSMTIGPLARDPLLPGTAGSDELDLRHLLSALVARAESSSRDDGCWLRLDVIVPAGSRTT
jgi:hypothetical protein